MILQILLPALAMAAVQDGRHGAPRGADLSPLVVPSCRVLGLGVEDESQKHLGEIGDLLIEPRSGEIRYAILEIGGVLGAKEDQRIVPWALIQVAPAEEDPELLCARTELSEERVNAAPELKRRVFDAELDSRIQAVFGRDPAWKFAGDGATSFVWLRQLDGALVQDSSATEIGSVRDVILAPGEGCVAYAVVETTEAAGDRDVALPWSQLGFAYGVKADGKKVLVATTSVPVEELENAPAFDRNDRKRMTSVAWIDELSTYYGCEPFWKASRVASARRHPDRDL